MMRRFFTLCACLATMLTPCRVHADETDGALSVMTFNIRYGTAKDGEDAWPKRKERVVALIREAAPDILGLQECLGFQAEYLAEQLPAYAWEGRGRDADGGGEMCAVFYRKDRLEATSVTHFWLSEAPDTPGSKAWDAALTRMATVLRFRDKQGNGTLHCITTHFDHRGAQARLESARLLAARAAEVAPEIPIVVLGDFNAVGEDSAPWDVLCGGVLRDAWRLAEKRSGPANTSNGFETPAPDAARRIDWILVREGMRVLRCATLDQRVDGRYPSDHFPVLAVVAFP